MLEAAPALNSSPPSHCVTLGGRSAHRRIRRGDGARLGGWDTYRMQQAGSVVESRDRLIVERLVLVLGTAMGSLIAFLVTNARCGAVGVLGDATGRSSYCKALGLPAWPSSVGSALLAAAIFCGPIAIALIGAAIARRADGRIDLRVPVALSLAGLAISFILIGLAHANLGAD
jgi:hypothetical protein